MKCIICGKEIERSQYAHSVLCSSECFEIDYWNDIVANKQQYTIIDGRCYKIVPDEPKGYFGFVGCGGREFKIKLFSTGEVIVTHNLWVQGKIPESHKPMLPDTAEFVK